MKSQEVVIESGREKLAATIAYPIDKPRAALLRISGGYVAGHRPNDWQEVLAQSGILSIGFDFPGVGESTGSLEDTSLDIRLDHARNVSNYFLAKIGNDIPITLLGVSMGGPIAIRLAGEQSFAKLVLNVPAAYPGGAWSKKFGQEFTEAIKGTDGKGSAEFEMLERVNIPTMLSSASHDDIIPRSITDKYAAILRGKGQLVKEYDAPHTFLRLDGEAPEAKRQFWSDLIQFVLEG